MSKQAELDLLLKRNKELTEMVRKLRKMDMEKNGPSVPSLVASNSTVVSSENLEIFNQAFDYYDSNSDGLLSKVDFQAVIADLGEAMNPEEINAAWSIVNPSGKNEITRGDFIDWVSHPKRGDSNAIAAKLDKAKLNLSTRVLIRQASSNTAGYISKLAKVTDNSIASSSTSLTIGTVDEAKMKIVSKVTFPREDKVNEIFALYGVSSEVAAEYTVGYFAEFVALESVSGELSQQVMAIVEHINQLLSSINSIVVPSIDGSIIRLAWFVKTPIGNNEVTAAILETYRQMEIVPLTLEFKHPFEHYMNSTAPLLDFTNLKTNSNVEYNRYVI